MFFKSVRFKSLLWYILFLTLTLSAFSALTYGNFKRNLYDDFDDLLSSRAEGVINSIGIYWTSQGASIDGFIGAAKDWVEEKRKDPDLMSIFVRIVNVKGETVVASKSIPRVEAIPVDDFNDVLKGEESFNTVKGELLDGKKHKFRVYTRPVSDVGGIRYIVQVIGPVGLVALALKNLEVILFILLPLTILLAAVPGILLARITLRPVDKMVKTLKQITAENLKLKIHIPDTKDEITRLADTFNDMIERLDRSFASQQRFIQDVSNKLKMPISILKEELQQASRKGFPQKDQEVILSRTLEEMDGLSRIIEDLLILSRFGNNQILLEIRRVNLVRLIESVLKDMKIMAEQKDIASSFTCDDKIILDGDENQLRRLFLNLLDNAIKYTHRGGKVNIDAVKDGKFVKISISDTGIGIPEDEIPYIFDRFYQVAKLRGATSGFGLGLSSAKSIVDGHQGEITVISQPSKGSIFTIILPLSYPG